MGNPQNRWKSEKGQVSIMVGAMMMTFLFFFAFVINIGMLVNAKINLQNAADLAAFAGASVQARQLTQISYINYEMRRQWKKYLFRIFVLGNMSQDGFPKSAGSGPMTYVPNLQSPKTTYPAPSTCIVFSENANPCHTTDLPKIRYDFPNPMGDGITAALQEQLKALESIRENNCKAIGITNQILNLLWTFNTDPSVSSYSQADSSVPEFLKEASASIRAYAKGLGVVPREIILKLRINTLSGYVNSPAIKGLNFSRATNLSNTADPAAQERSIQAFFSAYYTLGNHTFPSESIMMDELIPGDTTQANLLKLKTVGAVFDIYALDLDLEPDGKCVPKLYATAVASPLTLGFYKDESIQTYYAVRLKAKARLLFSPLGDLDLTAYAAAKPFGSRIGPTEGEVGFFSDSQVQGSPTGKIPNLTIKEDESGSTSSGVSRGSGWDTKSVIGTMYSAMVSGANMNGGTTQLQPFSVERAYSTAMAPNPWESGRYNIFNSELDSFQGDFATGSTTEGGFTMKYMTFWAPIVPPDKISQLKDQLKTELDTLFDPSKTQGSISQASNGKPLDNLKLQIMVQLESYINALKPSGSNAPSTAIGENGETINMIVLTDPFKRLSAPGTLEGISGAPEIFMSTDPNQLKTSWKWAKNGTLKREGRDGYSVKFVSFSSLSSKKSGSWTNDLGSVGDTEISKVLQTIQH